MGYHEEPQQKSGKRTLRPEAVIFITAVVLLLFSVGAWFYYINAMSNYSDVIKAKDLQIDSLQKTNTGLLEENIQLKAKLEVDEKTIKGLIELQKSRGKMISIPKGSVVKIESKQ